MASTKKNTPMSLDELAAQLGTNPYTALTEEQILQQAQNKINPQYDAQRLAAKQQQEALAQSLQQSLTGLDDNYAFASQQQQKATQQAVNQADRAALQRGMARSSYNVATQASLNQQGNDALARLTAELTGKKTDVASRVALSQQQLAQTLAGLDTQQASALQAAMTDIKNLDYQRQQEATNQNNAMLMDLYKLGQATKSGGSGPTKTPPPTVPPPGGTSYQSLINGLGTGGAPAFKPLPPPSPLVQDILKNTKSTAAPKGLPKNSAVTVPKTQALANYLKATNKKIPKK